MRLNLDDPWIGLGTFWHMFEGWDFTLACSVSCFVVAAFNRSVETLYLAEFDIEPDAEEDDMEKYDL